MKKIMCFGEIMLRLKSPGNTILFQNNELEATFGGGEANVAVSLANYGDKSSFVTVLPDNHIGTSAKRELCKYGVDVDNIVFNKGRMGIYYLEAGAACRPSKVIYDRDYSAFAMLNENCFDWDAILNDIKWVHITGITPAISSATCEETLKMLAIAKGKGIKVSVDLNYRAKLWNYGKSACDVMPLIVKYADVVIGNEEDCQKALGIFSEVDAGDGNLKLDSYKKISNEVMRRFPNVSIVAITLRESISANHNKWSACINDGKEFYRSRIYDIDYIVDRVGGGDSFAGGLIHGLINDKTPDEAVEFAVAASCLKHTVTGDFNLVSGEDVYSLMNSAGNGRIVR